MIKAEGIVPDPEWTKILDVSGRCANLKIKVPNEITQLLAYDFDYDEEEECCIIQLPDITCDETGSTDETGVTHRVDISLSILPKLVKRLKFTISCREQVSMISTFGIIHATNEYRQLWKIKDMCEEFNIEPPDKAKGCLLTPREKETHVDLMSYFNESNASLSLTKIHEFYWLNLDKLPVNIETVRFIVEYYYINSISK